VPLQSVLQADPDADFVHFMSEVLQGFGTPGGYVFMTGEAIPDMRERAAYLLRSFRGWEAKRAEGDKWRELPVDFQSSSASSS